MSMKNIRLDVESFIDAGYGLPLVKSHTSLLCTYPKRHSTKIFIGEQ